MKLIIGGYAQGKKEYVINKYNLSDESIFETRLPNEDEIANLTDSFVVIDKLNLWLKPRIQNGENPEDEVLKFVDDNPDCIIICDEIGNGVVPMDPMEREYRERTGRLLITLAEKAESVERIICGIPQKIK